MSYVKTDPPREWARKHILALEKEVAALKTKTEEHTMLLKALCEVEKERWGDRAFRVREENAPLRVVAAKEIPNIEGCKKHWGPDEFERFGDLMDVMRGNR